MRRLLSPTLLLSLLAACGGPKQAEDPRSLLEGDLDYRGVDGTQGTDPEGTGLDEPKVDKVDKDGKPMGPRVATRAECKNAATRMIELGIGKGRKVDPKAKQKLIERQTQACLEDETSDREAACITRAGGETDLEDCFQRRAE